MMEKDAAIKVLSALAHDSRLELLRQLVKAGEEGMNVGTLAKNVEQNIKTVSAQLLVMSNAGLVTSSKAGKQVIYQVKFLTLASMFAYIMEDCCGGHCGLRKTLSEMCCK